MVSHSTNGDYYKELGVHRHATANVIRAAYKRLALIWHPDRNKAKDAEEKFKKIKRAHDVLVDDRQRREYDHEQQQQRTWFEKTSRKSTQRNKGDLFNLKTFENLMSTPIDPFDILNDIQFFQESDFTSKMMNSPSYRNLYTQLFNSMNNNDPDSKTNPLFHSSTPVYVNNDRLFRPSPKARSKQTPRSTSSSSSSKYAPIKPIPVIHSTMPHDWFLNELIDLYEQQTASSPKDPRFNDLTDCTNCHRKKSSDRSRLVQQEKQCQSKSVRV